MRIVHISLIIILAPLIGALIAGLFPQYTGRRGAHTVTIAGVSVSLMLSFYLAFFIYTHPVSSTIAINTNLYTWASGGFLFPFAFHLGLLIDNLTVLMLIVVTFISLLVHIYSIGYMEKDPGYQRFFCYISLFTFMMLMLVTANNFLQLFFGWEGVGLVSYLLISFWYQKEAAIAGGLKAFIVNRVGDFGFILGIGMVLAYAGTLDYATVFHQANFLAAQELEIIDGHSWSVLTVTCLLLFVGAMGKSAQVPLHVWLPESMEGPTPISALIHAATMVTAGVFMVARLSPLIELSAVTLNVILAIGATGALFTGLLAIVMNDIKRVIAYSTLSQLGYMMVAMGVSAYSAGIFHLLTHAFFKALLFLAAGSVIIGLHHEQDMRKMGGLWRKMPITYVTFVIGCLALCAIPPFAGFYSKDTIIEATKIAQLAASNYAYFCVSIGAGVTAIYTFRALFMTFHGKSRIRRNLLVRIHESPWVVWLPLVILAILSVIIGYLLYMPILFSTPGLLGRALFVLPEHNVLATLAKEIHAPLTEAIAAVHTQTFWISMGGIFIAWLCYIVFPALPQFLARTFTGVYYILLNKYGFDAINNIVFVRGVKGLGRLFYEIGDQRLIDSLVVNGSAKTLEWLAQLWRRTQTGYLYDYVAVMMLGLYFFLCWLLFA